MAESDEQQSLPRRKPLRPLIDPDFRRPPSGRLGESDLINDSHGQPSGAIQDLKPEPQSRWWFVVFGFILLLILAGFGMIFVASESTESAQFRELAEEMLSQQLQAEVEIAPIEASSFFFVKTPEIRINGIDGTNWSLLVRNASMEIDRKSLTSEIWRFHNFQASEIEVSLGRRHETEPPQEASPSLAARLSEMMSLGPFDTPADIQFEQLRAAKFRIVGWESAAAEGPAFELEAPAHAAYDNGMISFETGAGLFKMGLESTPWEVEAFAAVIDPLAGGVSIEAGRLRGADGASIEIQHRNPAESAEKGAQQLLLGVEADQIPIRANSGELIDPAIGNMIAKGRGELRVPIDAPMNYHFRGAFELTGLQLGRSELFELLANQTGDDRLRRLAGKTLAAEVDWTPEKLDFRRLVLEADEVVKLDGSATFAGGQLDGEIAFLFPTEIIDQIPGGSPAGFSSTETDWSQATVKIGGSIHGIQEDLSKRLLSQIAPDVTVSAAPLIDNDGSPGRVLDAEKTKARHRQIESLFQKLLEAPEEDIEE